MAAVSGQGRDVHEAQDPLSSYIPHPARDGGRGCGPCAAAAVGTWSIRLRRAQWRPASRAAGCVCAQGLHVRVSQLRARSGRRSSTWGRVVPPRGPPPPRLRGFHQPLRMEARSPVLCPLRIRQNSPPPAPRSRPAPQGGSGEPFPPRPRTPRGHAHLPKLCSLVTLPCPDLPRFILSGDPERK